MVDLPDGVLSSWAVAFGTLLLAIVAFYQARLIVSERKANHAREMVDKIYLPLRSEARAWLNPEGFDFGHWQMVKDQYPHLVQSVPTELGPIFAEAGPLISKMQTLSLETRDLVLKTSKTMTKKMGLQSKVVNGSGDVSFGILRKSSNDRFFGFYLKDLWLSGKSLKGFVSQRVERQWPGLEWEIDLLIDGMPAGDVKQAEEFAEGALELLAEPPSAHEYLTQIERKKILAEKAISIIDEQINKSLGVRKPLRARIKERLKRRRRGSKE